MQGSRVSPRAFYRTVAIAEAITWTGLLIGMALKYGLDVPVAVLVAGSIHGMVFITYALTAVLVGVNQRWAAGRIAFAVATAIIPYATIPFDRHLERRRMLDGEWRHTATDDPRDRQVLSRLLRFFLARPATLVAVFVAAVVVIMTVMLIIGPPGGRK
jgi:integral membrane protein